MSDEQKFCRTCNWSSRNHSDEVQYCLRQDRRAWSAMLKAQEDSRELPDTH